MLKKLIPALILVAAVITPAHAVDIRSVIPYTVGNRWEYSVTEMDITSFGEGISSKSTESFAKGNSVTEVVSIKEQRSNDEAVYLERETEKLNPVLNTQPSTIVSESLVMTSPKGFFSTAERSSDMDGNLRSKWQRYNPPLLAFNGDLTPGKAWEIGTAKEEGAVMPMKAQVLGIETVTVPAGTFKDCIKVCAYTGTITGGFELEGKRAEIRNGREIHTVWIYPGVGVVKEMLLSQIQMAVDLGNAPGFVIMTGTQRKISELKPGYIAK